MIVKSRHKNGYKTLRIRNLRNRSEPTLPNLVSLLKHSEVLYHLLYMMGILVVRGLWNSARSFQWPSRVSEHDPG